MDSRHARVELALSLAVIMLAGCRYSAGSLSYAANPELKPVTLYKGAPSDVGRDVGPVETYMRGRSSCTDLGTAAVRELLAEAQAMGATGVKDVRFRARYHWTGRVVCRGSFLGMAGRSVQVRGIAYSSEP